MRRFGLLNLIGWTDGGNDQALSTGVGCFLQLQLVRNAEWRRRYILWHDSASRWFVCDSTQNFNGKLGLIRQDQSADNVGCDESRELRRQRKSALQARLHCPSRRWLLPGTAWDRFRDRLDVTAFLQHPQAWKIQTVVLYWIFWSDKSPHSKRMPSWFCRRCIANVG